VYFLKEMFSAIAHGTPFILLFNYPILFSVQLKKQRREKLCFNSYSTNLHHDTTSRTLTITIHIKLHSPIIFRGLGASLLQNEISPSPKVRLEGYLAKKVSTSLLRSTWTRYYFLLQGEDLYYYTSKESYLLDPKRPVLSRPLVVSSYDYSLPLPILYSATIQYYIILYCCMIIVDRCL
jgi:hypothetical protein